MNPNEEMNGQNEQDSASSAENEDIGAQEESTQLTPADTAPSARANLNPYQKWQEQWGHLLMDGTCSQQSYIKVAENELFEYGVQPRILPGAVKLPDGSKELGLILAFRVRTAFKAMDEEYETSASKVEQLKGFTVPPAGWNWSRVSNQRISNVVQFGVPLNPTKGGALNQFLTLLDSNLFDKLLGKLPTPVDGWDTSLLRQARNAYAAYLMVCVNQFGLFQNNEEQVVWDSSTESGELTPELVAYLDSLQGQEDPAASVDPEDELDT